MQIYFDLFCWSSSNTKVIFCFSVYTGISVPVHFFSSRDGSYASTCSTSTGNVLKAPAYIIALSLCMLSSILVFLGKLCFIISSHCLSLIYILHCTVLQGFSVSSPLFARNYFNSIKCLFCFPSYSINMIFPVQFTV